MRQPNPQIVVEDLDPVNQADEPETEQRRRNALTFLTQQVPTSSPYYDDPDSHTNLNRAISNDPMAIRESLAFALGTDGNEPQWLAGETGYVAEEKSSPKQKTLHHDHSDLHSDNTNPFEIAGQYSDMTHDIPMITLNTSAVNENHGENDDLETGLYMPPVSPAKSSFSKGSPSKAALGSSSKFAHMFSRMSERIAGSSNPPTPAVDKGPSSFQDSDLIDIDEARRQSIAREGTPVSFPLSPQLSQGSWRSSGAPHATVSSSIEGLSPSNLHNTQASSRVSLESMHSILSHEQPHMPAISEPTLHLSQSTIQPAITQNTAPPLLRPGAEKTDPAFDYLYLYGKSLKIFKPTSDFRIWCHRFVSHPRFNSAVMIHIILQTALLFYRQWDPMHNHGYYYSGYNWADYLLMVINFFYTVEIFIKVVAYGFIDDRAMFEELGLTYPRSGLTYARIYISRVLMSSYFWWLPEVRDKLSKGKRKNRSSEATLRGKYSEFKDNGNGDTPTSLPEDKQGRLIGELQHIFTSTTSLREAPPNRKLPAPNTFLQSTHIHKKVEEMNLRRAYLRSNWQRLDFISMVCFWISLLLSINHYDADHNIMLFRALSCLRILRLCNLTTGTNVILRACQSAIPQLVDVCIVIVCFWVIFGIIGVQSFKSSLTRHCEWTNPDDSSDTWTSDQYCGSFIGLDGHAKGYIDRLGENTGYIKGYRCPMYSVCRSGENPSSGRVNFDNILQSMQLVFVLMSVNAFSDLMYNLMNTDSIAASLFFIFGMLILTVWLMNVFVAVIVTSFKIILKEEAEITKQRDERRTRTSIFNVWRVNDEMHTQKVLELINRRKWLRLYYRLEYFFVVTIAVALIVQCFRTEQMSTHRAHLLYRMEASVTALLLAEIILRLVLYAPYWRIFFGSKMNCFDLLLAIVTSIIIFNPVKEKLGHAYYWLTFFQIVRFYRVVLAHRVTSNLWVKLMRSAKPIYDLTLFFFILLVLVSLIGARFYEGLVPADQVDSVQFAMHTWPNAFISFYVITSTENWASIMYSLQEYSTTTSQSSFSSIMIILWFIISNFIVMNIFIAVIAQTLEISDDGKRKHQLVKFIEDMTQKLLAVEESSGWIGLIKTRLFGKKDDRNMERAVTNLLLSGSAVNDFLEEAQGYEQEDEYVNQLRNQDYGGSSKGTRWFDKYSKKIKKYQQNPFYTKRKQVIISEADFNPAVFAKEVITERRNLIQEQDNYLRDNPMFNTVFYMLKPRHRLRRMCQRIVPSSYGERIDGVEPNRIVSEVFGIFMFLSTVGIVITACYLTPLLRRELLHKYGDYNWTFIVDTSFIIIFSMEFNIKIIADGFLLTPNAYMRSPWNWLDLCALLSLWIELIAFLKNDGNLSRVVRGLKALRALRILTISETAKNNFQLAMMSGFGKIVSAAIISLTLIFPFSVWGLNIFNGRLGYCLDGESSYILCVNEFSNTVFDWDVLSPNAYVEPILEMNTFLKSFSTLYEIVSLEGWTDLLINVMQSTGIGTPQEMFATPINGFFVMFFNFASVVFILTLFVSVIIDNYALATGRAFLTDSQRQWYHVKKFLLQVKPSKRKRPESLQGIRKFCYGMTVDKNKYWQGTLNVMLLIHVFALIIESFPEHSAVTNVRYAAFTLSTTCFLIHYLMFAYAQQYKVFVANKWNIFFLFVSCGGWLTTVLSYAVNSGSVFYNFNKLFLVAMLVFVFPRSNRISQMLKFASASFPQLISLLFTWFVMFMVYAIALNQIFGLTRLGPNTTDNINVRSVPKALILLFRCSLGEGWNYIMEDFTIESPSCQNAHQIDDSDCGNKQYAYLLFMSWNIISMYIMLNLFVSLILASFSYISEGSKQAQLIARDEIRKFKNCWLEFDPEGTGFISPEDLPKFLHSLDGSLSFHFYKDVLSIPELCQKWIRRNNLDDPYDITVDYRAMHDTMALMDIPKIQERRRMYEQFMEEAIMNMELHEEKGISFKRLLLQIPLYNSFDARQCLNLIDFLERRLFMKKVEKRLMKKRCYELLEGYICRWKYVKNKREEQRRSVISQESSMGIDPTYRDFDHDDFKYF